MALQQSFHRFATVRYKKVILLSWRNDKKFIEHNAFLFFWCLSLLSTLTSEDFANLTLICKMQYPFFKIVLKNNFWGFSDWKLPEAVDFKTCLQIDQKKILNITVLHFFPLQNNYMKGIKRWIMASYCDRITFYMFQRLTNAEYHHVVGINVRTT